MLTVEFKNMCTQALEQTINDYSESFKAIDILVKKRPMLAFNPHNLFDLGFKCDETYLFYPMNHNIYHPELGHLIGGTYGSNENNKVTLISPGIRTLTHTSIVEHYTQCYLSRGINGAKDFCDLISRANTANINDLEGGFYFEPTFLDLAANLLSPSDLAKVSESTEFVKKPMRLSDEFCLAVTLLCSWQNNLNWSKIQAGLNPKEFVVNTLDRIARTSFECEPDLLIRLKDAEKLCDGFKNLNAKSRIPVARDIWAVDPEFWSSECLIPFHAVDCELMHVKELTETIGDLNKYRSDLRMIIDLNKRLFDQARQYTNYNPSIVKIKTSSDTLFQGRLKLLSEIRRYL